jgi:hypothetical protein
MLCVGASKTRSASAIAAGFSHRDGNRGIEVGFNTAKAGPGVHASVPTSPVIDGRGCRRRRLDGYISRESRPARGMVSAKNELIRLVTADSSMG